jgi:hypothetical protein
MLAKSPNRKRAEQYLAASGAVPITIIDTGKISTNVKITGTVAARWWIAAADAARVAGSARQCAGADPDVATATAAVLRSAASLRATLTPDDVAIARAGAAMARLDEYLASLKGTGTLKEFNRRYKRGREAARAQGQGFMGYSTAMARLKLALVPMLASGKPGVGVFDEVFR